MDCRALDKLVLYFQLGDSAPSDSWAFHLNHQTTQVLRESVRFRGRSVSVLKCGQGLKQLSRRGSTQNGVVFANLSVFEDQNSFSELCDVGLVSDEHDR